MAEDAPTMSCFWKWYGVFSEWEITDGEVDYWVVGEFDVDWVGGIEMISFKEDDMGEQDSRGKWSKIATVKVFKEKEKWIMTVGS